MGAKQAIVICPGRGSYTKEELGYLKRHSTQKQEDLLDSFDAYRKSYEQVAIQDLDRAEKFQTNLMTRGENASALIYACSLVDYLNIDPEKIEVVGIIGNSMGWYITLALSGAISHFQGLELINTMGSMMKDQIIGAQAIYSLVDEQWKRDSNAEKATRQLLEAHSSKLFPSISLGGMQVLGGTQEGISLALKTLPKKEGKYPFQLTNHGAFHTPLLHSISEMALKEFPIDFFGPPKIPIVDGAGKIRTSYGTDVEELRSYTLKDQVLRPYDFTASLEVALKEFAPDCLILLGPGSSLGAPIGQTCVQLNWHGMESKLDFQKLQKENPFLLSMAKSSERSQLV